MKICIAGKNNISVDILEYLLHTLKYEINKIFVIPNKTDTGEDGWQRSLLKYATLNNISVTNLENIYEHQDLIFLSLEFDTIIKPNKFRSQLLYNIHFSLLPKYKGMFTSILPILNNDLISGVTLHKIEQGIDTGDIIAQKEFTIDLNDNSRDTYFKYLKFGSSLIKEYLPLLIKNKALMGTKQSAQNSSYYSKQSINFTNLAIDLNQTAIQIHNQIRAYNFREYQQPNIFGSNILSSKILTIHSTQKPGKIIFENEISYTINTIDYNLVLYKDKSIDLFKACEKGNLSEVQKLLQIPKIINVQNQNGWTPLIVAIYNNHVEIVKTLLINGADVKIKNFKGTTCLMYAKSSFIKHNDPTILNLLLDLDNNLSQKDYEGKNIIDYCTENNETIALQIIKDKIT
ncbi:MAG: ankyrin repeat domain-containing protein [Sulfurospirillaceae bacterium]|nr:ankyrin repeat domain-containing protein [Sulfurospirillaceae bacterium]MDD2826316.1 ankyrin repeat domain-containing protein [Sulfurospirillaceae bacterium]